MERLSFLCGATVSGKIRNKKERTTKARRGSALSHQEAIDFSIVTHSLPLVTEYFELICKALQCNKSLVDGICLLLLVLQRRSAPGAEKSCYTRQACRISRRWQISFSVVCTYTSARRQKERGEKTPSRCRRNCTVKLVLKLTVCTSCNKVRKSMKKRYQIHSESR